jgi:hypothetical protein
MAKNLREIVNMKAPDIAVATQWGKTVYVKDSKGNILFILVADELLSYTGQTITIRLGTYAMTYNNAGSQISIQTLFK